jgi:hypothetical protein
MYFGFVLGILRCNYHHTKFTKRGTGAEELEILSDFGVRGRDFGAEAGWTRSGRPQPSKALPCESARGGDILSAEVPICFQEVHQELSIQIELPVQNTPPDSFSRIRARSPTRWRYPHSAAHIYVSK